VSGSRRWLDQAPDPAGQALRRALDEVRPEAEADAFAMQRVWGRVQAPWWDGSGKLPNTADAPVGRRRWLTPLLAGAGVASAAMVVLLVTAGLPRPAVAPGAGPVATSEGPGVPLPKAPLTTGPGESSQHQLAGGVEVQLQARTALLPGDAQSPPVVQVGQVRFSVPHQRPGERFRVRAGGYQVVVLGTVFTVTVDQRGVAVDVESGVVEVQDEASGQRLQRLPAGARWSSEPASTASTASTGSVSSRRATASPIRSTRRSPARALATQPAGGASADPARALAQYQKIAEGGGPMAEVALYNIGEIEQESLRDLNRASATWQRYAARYPQGLLRVEADLSLIDALVGLGERGRALAEAQAFLQRHRQSERRPDVARLAGDLAREAGDCGQALGFYDLALRSGPAPDDEDDALFYRAECLSLQGDPGSAAAGRAYLGRFPLGRHAVQAQQLLRARQAPGGEER
jgi:ferric-dicitrate binding protein FerR (iron transport regulator)